MKILLVDDSAVLLRAATEMMVAAGIEVEVAQNGREALRRVAPGSHAAVIVDIVMPEMDGFETMRAIRAVDADVRIVAMTGRLPALAATGTIDYLKFASAFGANATLRKPFVLGDLLAALGVTPPDRG